MAGNSMHLLYESFYSWAWQNQKIVPQLVVLLRNLADSKKLEEFLAVVSAVAAHEMHVREAGEETNEMLLEKAVA